MLNDKQLEDLSYEIDDFLVKCSNKYKVGTLSLSAVTLARLIRAVEVYGERKDLLSQFLDITVFEQLYLLV